MKGYSRQVLVMGGLTTLIVVALIGLTFKLLHDITVGANELDQKRDRQLIAAAFSGLADQISGLVEDNAIWDDAVDHTSGAADEEWIAETWGMTSGSSNYDAVHVLNAELVSLSGFYRSKPGAMPAEEFYGKGLARLVSKLRTANAKEPVSGFMITRLGPAVVAVSPILPMTVGKALPEEKPRLLVISKMLTANLVGNLGRKIGLPNLALVARVPQDGFAVPIGERALPAGFVAWKPAMPGDAVLARVWNPFLVTLFAALAAVIILALSALRLSRDLGDIENRAAAGGAAVVLAEISGDPVTCESLKAGLAVVAGHFGAETGSHGANGFAALFEGKHASRDAGEYARALEVLIAEPFDIGGRHVQAQLRVGCAYGDSAAACAKMLREAAASMKTVPAAA